MASTSIRFVHFFIAPWKGVLMVSMQDHGPTALRGGGLRAAGEEQARRRDDFPSRLVLPTVIRDLSRQATTSVVSGRVRCDHRLHRHLGSCDGAGGEKFLDVSRTQPGCY